MHYVLDSWCGKKCKGKQFLGPCLPSILQGAIYKAVEGQILYFRLEKDTLLKDEKIDHDFRKLRGQYFVTY